MSQKNLIQAIILIVINLSFISLSAQTTYRLGNSPAINNATINTCSGTFVDSGGTGNYGGGQDITVTFCSSNGKPMVANFTAFSMEGGACNNDYLKIYNGNASSTDLIGTFCDTISPNTITSYGGQTCLKFVYHSNSTVESSGWSANLSCYECLDNQSCASQYVNLQFSNPSIEATASGLVGDKWRFPNVMTGIDAIVEIVAAVGVNGINTIDNPSQPVSKTFAWSPEITIPTNTNGDHYVDWRVQLVNAGGNTPTPLPQASRVTSYDVDGNNNYREIHGHVNPNGYILNNPTELTILNEPPFTTILGSTTEHEDISDDSEVKGTFYYASQLLEFNIRLGARVSSSNGTPNRQYAVSFEACPQFGNPVTNPIIPTISGDFNLCQNELTQIYSLSNTFSSIQWTVRGGTISGSSTSQSVTVNWNSTPGVKRISVVTVDGASCLVNNSKSVIVNGTPTASATGATVCVGQTINLTSSGGTTYAWTGPSFTSSAQNPVISNAQTGNAGTYTVTVTDANGCSNTANATVVVNTTPTITLTATEAQACRGSTNATLSYSATGGSPTTFSIDFASGITDIVNAPFSGGVLNIPISGSLAVGTYTGNLTINNAACSSSSIPITVQIFNPATVNAGPDLTVCTGSSVSSIPLANATRGGGSSTATWTILIGGGSLSGASNVADPSTSSYTPPAYIPANGNYSIDVTLQLLTNDPAGPCPAVSDTRTIFVNYLVGGTITGAQTICIDGDPSIIGN